MRLDPAAGGRVRKGIRLAAALDTFVKTPVIGQLIGQNYILRSGPARLSLSFEYIIKTVSLSTIVLDMIMALPVVASEAADSVSIVELLFLGENIAATSCIRALHSGLLLADIYQGSMDSTVFESFIERLLPLCGRWPEPNAISRWRVAHLQRHERENETLILNIQSIVHAILGRAQLWRSL